jgi:hypothetical protein
MLEMLSQHCQLVLVTHNIPAIPMVSILRRYAYENKLPWDGRWETIMRVFNHYSLTAKYLN